MQYIQVTFRIDTEEDYVKDILAAMLGDIGFESFEETNRGLAGYCPASVFAQKKVVEIIENLPIPHPETIKFRIETIEDQNWNKAWESTGYEPIQIGDDCVVHAKGKAIAGKFKYDIEINPTQSFGSGYHETTRMMIKYLLELDLSGKQVLDMGCGTAVLSILASMKRTSNVLAIDIDSWATSNAEDNIRTNGLTNIKVLQGDASLLDCYTSAFDIILANINRNILLNDMDSYVQALSENGKLIMSGFYKEDTSLIEDKANSLGLKLLSVKEENNWTALVFER